MTAKKTPQTMNASTAAKKLGVYLQATPQEFQDSEITREEFNTLQADPPQWLTELRTNGPHPRPVVAARLGVSIAALARGGHSAPLTTDEIAELREEDSAWLQKERAIAEEVRAEEDRIKERDAKLAKKTADKTAAKSTDNKSADK